MPLGAETVDGPLAPEFKSDTDADCITDIKRPGKRPKTMTTRVPTAIGISIPQSARPSRGPEGWRRNIALSTRT